MPDYRNFELLSQNRLPEQGKPSPQSYARLQPIPLAGVEGLPSGPGGPPLRSLHGHTEETPRNLAAEPPLQTALVGTLSWDSHSDRVFMDEGMADFLGMQGSGSLGSLEDLSTRIDSGDRQAVLAQVRRCMLQGSDFSTCFAIRGARSRQALSWLGTAVAGVSGRPVRLLLSGHRLPSDRPDTEQPPGGDALVCASHDIRTSINAILGFSQLLQHEQGLSASQRRYVDTIASSANELLHIIGDVLSHAKRGGTAGDSPSFRLADMMAGLVEMIRVGRAAVGVDVKFELLSDDLPITADRVKIRRILVNLLDNALKFTEQGRVRLRGGYLRSGAEGGGEAIFEVEDTGPGICPDDLERIFEPYRQLAGPCRDDSGIGLGLPIAINLARQLGGDIQVESRVGQGTCFRVSIPVNCEPTADTQERPHSSPPRTATVVGEDGADLQKSLALLDRLGYRPNWRPRLGPDDGLFIARQAGPLLVDVTGLVGVRNWLAGVRESLPNRMLAVVAICDPRSEPQGRELLDAGVGALLIKPFSDEQLSQALSRAIGPAMRLDRHSAGNPKSTPPGVPEADGLPERLADAGPVVAQSSELVELNGLISHLEAVDQGLAQDLRSMAIDMDYEQVIEVLDPREF